MSDRFSSPPAGTRNISTANGRSFAWRGDGERLINDGAGSRRCLLAIHVRDLHIKIMPAITSTSSRMHGEFLRLLFLQAHRETTAHFTAIGMPAQQHCDAFRFRRAAFYNGLKSKVGLAAAKTAAMRINLNIDGCGVVAPPVHSSLRAPHLLANLLAHNLPLPRAAH